MCGKGETALFSHWMKEKEVKDKHFLKFRNSEIDRIHQVMKEGLYEPEMRPFSWISRGKASLLDGVLRDMVTFWEACNMLNATDTNVMCINSPHSSFTNKLDETQVENRIACEYGFFEAAYFLTRDKPAGLRLFISGHGEKNELVTKEGTDSITYRKLVDIIITYCQK